MIASADKLSEFDTVEASRLAPDQSISAPSTSGKAHTRQCGAPAEICSALRSCARSRGAHVATEAFQSMTTAKVAPPDAPTMLATRSLDATRWEYGIRRVRERVGLADPTT